MYLWVFGQRLQREQCPVEHRGTYVCPSILPSVIPSIPLPIRPLRFEICLLSLKSALPALKFALSDQKSALAGLKSVLSRLKYVLPGLNSALLDFKSALSVLKSGWKDAQDFVSFEAAALLPLNPILNHTK